MADALEEQALLRRARKGDEEAGAFLYEKYLKENASLRRLLRRQVRDAAAHQDLLHEIYLRLIHGSSDFRGESSLRTYIYQIARRTILEQHRRAASAKRGGGSVRFVLPENGLVENQAGEEHRNPYVEMELGWILEKLFSEIPEAYRAALRLRIVEGKKYEEISALMGVNLNTVSTRIHKGKKILIGLMKKYGIWGRV